MTQPNPTLIIPALCVAGFASAHDDASGDLPVALSLTAGWNSRYVSEGRDNLNGDSLVGTTLLVGPEGTDPGTLDGLPAAGRALVGALEGFEAGLWYATSPEQDYRELNLFAGDDPLHDYLVATPFITFAY